MFLSFPPSFKYGSEDDNSSITSGSGFGAQSSPHSASQNMAQQQQQQHQGLPSACMQVPSLGTQHPTYNIDYRFLEQRDTLEKLQEKIQRLADEFEVYKVEVCELSPHHFFHLEFEIIFSNGSVKCSKEFLSANKKMSLKKLFEDFKI